MKNSKKSLLLILIVICVIVGIIAFGNKKSTSTQNALNTNNPSVATSPSTNQTNEDIWKTIQMKSTGISPILYPEKLPEGIQTQKIIRSEPGTFLVEYTGSGKKLDLLVDMISPGEIDAQGSQNQVIVRGQKGTSQIKNLANPNEFIWLWWEEPGTWRAPLENTTRNKIFYMITGEGFSAQEVQNFAESLKPLE